MARAIVPGWSLDLMRPCLSGVSARSITLALFQAAPESPAEYKRLNQEPPYLAILGTRNLVPGLSATLTLRDYGGGAGLSEQNKNKDDPGSPAAF